MYKYMGFKMIEAEPMTGEDAEKVLARPMTYNTAEGIWENIVGDYGQQYVHPGYLVKYPDGYMSWSPKKQFEEAYMQVGANNTITPEIVDKFIAEYETRTLGTKTTVVKAVLVNGFVVVKSSSCVDPENYDEAMGEDICLGKIKNKVWELLGFLLQTAKNGVKHE